MTADGGDRSFGAPGFDIVLRGYDRRQVDEHLSRLNRVLARMRSDLEAARGEPGPVGPPLGGRPRPTPRRRPEGAPGEGDDVVGTFTERMRTILQAAEDEAAEIRAKAHAEARAVAQRAAPPSPTGEPTREQAEAVRAELEDLVRQRDAVLADLTRVRGQLEALLGGPTGRIAVPVQGAPTGPRDPGVDQPLPGTATAPEPATAPAPAGRAPDAKPAERTAVLPTSEPVPAERTAVMPTSEGADPPRDGGAADVADNPGPPRAEATVRVAARPGAPAADPAPWPGSGADDRRSRPASVSRTG